MRTQQPARRVTAAGSGIGRATGFELPSPGQPGAANVEAALDRNRVVRNVGGRVTPEVINDVAFIGQLAENVLPDGPLFEVAVIHHTQCGTGALADDSFRRRYAQRIGAEESTLREHAVLDPAATVSRDVERLRSAPAISPRVTVSGHVYDVVTGLVQTVIPASSSADQTVEQAHIPQGDETP
jgi:carbonic anhydrase